MCQTHITVFSKSTQNQFTSTKYSLQYNTKRVYKTPLTIQSAFGAKINNKQRLRLFKKRRKAPKLTKKKRFQRQDYNKPRRRRQNCNKPSGRVFGIASLLDRA